MNIKKYFLTRLFSPLTFIIFGIFTPAPEIFYSAAVGWMFCWVFSFRVINREFGSKVKVKK